MPQGLGSKCGTPRVLPLLGIIIAGDFCVSQTHPVTCTLYYCQVPVPVIQGHQVFPVYTVGLGGGGTAGLPSGIQHAQSPHTSQELKLSPS